MGDFFKDLAAAVAIVTFLAGFSAVATGLAESGQRAPAKHYAEARP